MDMLISAASILARTVTNATPLVIAGTGGILCERSGVVNIGIEGIMLTGAFTAALGSYFSGSPWIGLVTGIGFSMLIALLHAYLCVTIKIDHIISGLAINIFASSMTVYLLGIIFKTKGNSPAVPQLPALAIKSAANIPVFGELLSNISIITVLGLLVVIAVCFILNYMPLGLHIIACGKKPLAASVMGINVNKTRYISVLIGGFCSGLAGAFLSISYMNMFVKNMIAGRGFIAIATIIFGNYNPFWVAVSGLIFGLFDALQMSLQGTIDLPPELIQCLPYLVTILAVVIALRRNKNSGTV
jgi:simple sugar transport system permease protein